MALDNESQERLTKALRRLARNKRKALALLEDQDVFELMLDAGMPRDQLMAAMDLLRTRTPTTKDEIAKFISREVPGSSCGPR
jgi:anthranilate phosphoribosyltransferase